MQVSYSHALFQPIPVRPSRPLPYINQSNLGVISFTAVAKDKNYHN